MAQETFTVVALPYSRSEERPFHVSLFVAPDLVPDGAEGELGDFPHWVEWAAELPSATVTLSNQLGQLAGEPLLDAIDAAVWGAVFPPDTPVRAREAPDWDDRHWRTFRASEVHDTAKLFSMFSMMTSPTARPRPDPRSDFVSLLMTTFSRGILDQRSNRAWDESLFTEAFDRLVGEPSVADRSTLDRIEKRIGAAEGLQRAFLELHRARRFYERPEGQIAYERRPVEGATLERPPKPDPDFHERVSLLGDHPGVLRKLGLVIDMRVDDLGSLAQSQFLRATITFADGLAGRSPETSVTVAGPDMVVPSSDHEWSAGRLRLGDEDLYKVLDMDADGSALKTDRFLWTVPRLIGVAQSGARESTATPAHRTGGFTITRTGRALRTQARLAAQKTIGADLAAGQSPRLDAADVIQGLRLEVWDDDAKAWYSLHRRRVDVEVLGHGPVLEDVAEEGFSQGTTASETARVADSPVHVHEAIASWGGWSLSATRPGKRVRHEDGDEIVEETTVDPDPSTPVLVEATAEPGSLPRLRYGRSYAFRAWGVDLAGNSRPHALGPVPSVPSQVLAQITATLSTTAAPSARPALGAANVAAEIRSSAGTVVMNRRAVDTERDGPPIVAADDLGGTLTGGLGITPTAIDLEAAILRSVRVRRTAAATRMGLAEPLAGVGRSALVEREFEELVVSVDRTPFIDVAERVPEIIAGGMGEGDTADDGLDTITALRPFLRWEPVQPPAVVSRHGNSPGESLLQLVIRSGVTQDRETLALTVSSPTEYAAANPGHRYRATSERHIAPPKTSQSEAELHGAFDFAIGSTDPADHAAALAWIVRESGTFFDVEIPRLDDPHTFDAQPGIALVKDPGTPDSTLKSLPLPAGEMPAPGQYIVHDVDELTLPYLPDPLSRGMSLVFPDAGRDRQLQFPFGSEGFTAEWPGSWPALEPFRLVLAPSEELTGDLTGRALTIGLPPGDVQRFRLSSSMTHDDLDLFGFWRLLPTSFRSVDEVAEAAADGWLWIFTPYDEITLVHAVPRPLESPRPTVLHATRTKGSPDSMLAGAIDLHGPSTEQLTAAASWTEYTDELSLPAPETSEQNGIAFVTQIRGEEDLAVLYGSIDKDIQLQIPGFGPVWFHRAVHQWGDTKHRMVRYQFRASTRFREYFHPTTLVPEDSGGGEGSELLPDDGQSVIGPSRVLSVPSSAKPAAPIIHSVLPLFRWETGTEPEQPVGVRRSRRAGIRIYLERPWYSSGEGELLGVLIAPNAADEGLENVVSQWGQDPVWRGTPVHNRALSFELDDLMHVSGLDDRPEAARPVTSPVTLQYEGVAGRPTVTVLGYEPEYNVERGLWFVDVAIDPGDRIWPFVRLAICRYQPESLPGCELSAPVKCDYQQLLPERTASVSRTDVRHARVVVSGAIGTRGPAESFPPAAADRHDQIRRNRIMVARLQRADPDIPTDLGWETVDTVELLVRGTGRTAAEAAWVGELEAPEEIPLARPGSNPDWRVTIEEWEILPGDPDPNPEALTAAPLPSWRRRLVYAESLLL
jgi:hypothetical protein